MNLILQIIGVCTLTIFAFKLKRLRFIYLAILILTHFFGFLQEDDLKIGDLNFITYYASVLVVIGMFYNKIYLYKKIVSTKISIIFGLILIFFFVQLSSLFFTLTNDFTIIQSFQPFLDFVPFIFIPWIYKLYSITDKKELKVFLKLIINLSVVNAFLYILNSLNILDFYSDSVLIKMDNGNFRSLEGFPLLFPILLPFLYLKLKKEVNLLSFAMFIITFLAMLLTFTRSLVLGGVIIILIAELVNNFRITKFQRIRFFLLGVIGIFGIFFFYGEKLTILTDRFAEGDSINKVENLSSRYNVAIDRINLTIDESPFFGLGFISENESYKLNLKVDRNRLIHPDIFWPNLITTTGLIGFFIFIIILIKLFKFYYGYRKVLLGQIMLLYFLFTIILTFTSGGILFKGSILFSIIVAYGLIVLEQNTQIRDENN